MSARAILHLDLDTFFVSCERLLDSRVHLALWVKVDPRWSKHPKRLKSLGYH